MNIKINSNGQFDLTDLTETQVWLMWNWFGQMAESYQKTREDEVGGRILLDAFLIEQMEEDFFQMCDTLGAQSKSPECLTINKAGE